MDELGLVSVFMSYIGIDARRDWKSSKFEPEEISSELVSCLATTPRGRISCDGLKPMSIVESIRTPYARSSRQEYLFGISRQLFGYFSGLFGDHERDELDLFALVPADHPRVCPAALASDRKQEVSFV